MITIYFTTKSDKMLLHYVRTDGSLLMDLYQFLFVVVCAPLS